MNNFTVKIKQNGVFVALTATAVFPFRFGELLDERLDEAYVDIINDNTEEYAPLTEFSITATAGGETVTKYYVLARDRAETNRFTEKVKHSLYLLERTKKLEGIVCPSLTFTNASGANYTRFSSIVRPVSITGELFDFRGVPEITSPVLASKDLVAPSVRDVGNQFAYQKSLYKNQEWIYQSQVTPAGTTYYSSLSVYIDGQMYADNIRDNDSVTISSESISVGSVIEYRYTVCTLYVSSGGVTGGDVDRFSFAIRAAKNYYPLKKWTITDCVNRVLFCAEPLETGYGQIFIPTPRYTFRADQATKYDAIIAPEFSMTQCTLREQLKVIGSYIHGEPRLDENDQIYFEDYGITAEANVSGLPCVYKAASWDINDFCTEIRSNAQNLVSALGYAEGALIEPAQGWYRSLRSETAYARITEDNGVVSTQYPIYEVDSLKCGILNADGTYYIEPREIKAYLFEATVYGANLSSYSSTYPFSKIYAIYYTQGSNNIQGLFYRASTDRENAIYGRYAIANILGEDASQQYEIDEHLQENPERLVFQITYKPIYPTLISHGKSLYVSGEERHAKVYNQGENLVETQYYGENLKGVAARLGNVERERTFLLSKFSQIPRTGQMIDGYAISAVSVEMMAFSLKCTVGLTKDFNRISEYIGVSSVKRMYEVSERMVYNRDILIHNTALISMNEPTSTDTALFKALPTFNAINNIFAPPNPQTNPQQPISMAAIYGTNKNDDPLYEYDISLPVIPTALGNAMTFYFAFKDNYSAGSAARYTEANAGVKGYWMDDVRYTDFYGRMYNLHFALYAGSNGATLRPSGFTPNSYELPEASGLFPDVPPDIDYAIIGSYAIRKDSRERISVTAELEFKTDDPSIIVGSGLARYCPLVSNVSDYGVEVYAITDPSVLPTKFDKKFTAESGYVDLSRFLKVEKMNYGTAYNIAVKISLTGHTGRTSYGWVICTASNPYTETVEDEDGVETTQTVERGRDILLARVNTVEGTSELFPPIYISILNE